MKNFIKEVDLTCLKCPINFFRAKWELLHHPHQVIRFIIYSNLVNYLVSSLKNEGFVVLNIEILDNLAYLYAQWSN